MKSPLTDEQQKKLLEISKLNPEKQKEELPKFFKTLSKEQIEFLKGQQKCLFCSIAKKEIKAYTVYEDESVMAVLDINPANKGHVILFPLNHAETLANIKEAGHIFEVAQKINSAIIKGLNALGTNIFIANGITAGQITPHFIIHIIPRFDKDGINFMWNAKKIKDDEMKEAAQKISANLEEKPKEAAKIELKSIKGIYEELERIP